MSKYWDDKQDNIDAVRARDFNDAFGAIANDIDKLLKGDSDETVDTEMSDTSTNPVQNLIIKAYVDESIRSAILDSWEVAV